MSSCEGTRGYCACGVNLADSLVPEVSVTTYYISGPMRHQPNFNYDMFNEVADHLRQQGHQVINPAENFSGDQTLTFETYMQTDLRQVLEADALVLLPGWEDSEGARLEVAVGRATGKTFRLAEQDHSWPERYWIISPVKDPEPGEGIEATARRLVYGDRNADYGPPTQDFTRTGRVWAGLLGLDAPITPEMVAIMMAALKLSRLVQTPGHKDSRTDVIGYALCLDRIVEDRAS